jgi:hypothetical protein
VVLMYELRFKMVPVDEGFCRWTAQAYAWNWRSLTGGASQNMEQDYNAAFADVMVWCESNLVNQGDRTKPDWWMFSEQHGRLFFADGANAMEFKLRWC